MYDHGKIPQADRVRGPREAVAHDHCRVISSHHQRCAYITNIGDIALSDQCAFLSWGE
jgi:hypothetical protein